MRRKKLGSTMFWSAFFAVQQYLAPSMPLSAAESSQVSPVSPVSPVSGSNPSVLVSPEADAVKLEKIEARLPHAKPSQDDFDALAAIIERTPNNANAHLVLGMCYEQMSLPEQAVKEYEISTKLNPKNPKPMIDAIRASINTNSDQHTHALISLALQKFRDDPDILFLAGMQAQKDRHYKSADALLTKAYSEKPDIAWLKGYYAESLYNRRRYSQAFRMAKLDLASYEQNPKLRSLPAVSHANLIAGLSLYAMGQKYWPQAVQYIGRATEIKSKPELAHQLAMMTAWTGRYEDAVVPAGICLGLVANDYNGPKDEELTRLLTECFRHAKKSVAMAYLDDISDHFPAAKANAYYFNSAGEALHAAGWNQEALRYFKKAVELKPTFAIAVYNLARVNEGYLHNYEEAIKLYKTAQGYGLPESYKVYDTISRLEDRLSVQKNDLAWQLKDMLRRPAQ